MEAYTISSLIIVGIVNRIKEYFPEVSGFWGFVMALILGTGFGSFQWFGLIGPEMGFTAGLISSGAYTIAKKIGERGGPIQPN